MSMATSPLCLITIVAEPVLETRLVEVLRDEGASGWTVMDARGEGSRQARAAEIPGARVRIESIVPRDVAHAVLGRLGHQFFADYGVVAFISEVVVLRPEKYSRAHPSRRSKP